VLCVDSVAIRRISSLGSLTLVLALASAGVAGATTWHDGDLVTYDEGAWVTDPSDANKLLLDKYPYVYESTFNFFLLGGVAPWFSVEFSDSNFLIAYLPASGPIGPFDANLLNPTSTAAGAFGGEVAALKLNVDFSDAGFLLGTTGLHFGDLVLHDLGLPGIDGLTVSQFLALANTAISGAPTSQPIATIDPITQQLNASFDGVAGPYVSQWAQDHLDAPVPEPGTFLLLGSGIAGLVLFGRTKRG